MTAQILVVKPKSLTPGDKKLLRAAGVVCIESADPSSVRLIQPEGSMVSGDDLLYAAMKAIRECAGENTKKAFSDTVARLVEQRFQEPPHA